MVSRPGGLCGDLIATMRPAVFFAEEVTVKPTAINSRPPLLVGFKTTPPSTVLEYITPC